jgi:hypothetical protein
MIETTAYICSTTNKQGFEEPTHMGKSVVERRRFPRIPFEADCFLLHNENAYRVTLQNISQNGALISFKSSGISSIVADGKCFFSVYRTGNKGTLRFTTKVIYSGFEATGLRFLEMDAETMGFLGEILHQHMVLPERIGGSAKLIRWT